MTTCYASALAISIPVTILILLAIDVTVDLLRIDLWIPLVTWRDVVIHVAHVVTFMCVVVVLIPPLWSIKRLCRAYRDVRFAAA